MKRITIEVPDDCEVQIVRKEEEKKGPVIRTYQDLINNHIKVGGYYIGASGELFDAYNMPATNINRNIASSGKVAKSMLAMAMISQLMPYYGGEVTNEEWCNYKINKFVIVSYEGRIVTKNHSDCYRDFLAFHTEKQRDEFLRYNEQLVKDYLMID